jgi:hypothetical protein
MSGESPVRLYTTLRTRAAEDIFMAMMALQRGIPFERPMTKLERVSLAVANARPKDHLTLHSDSMDREGSMPRG